MKKILIILFIILLPVYGEAAITIYVDKEGDDTNCTNSGGGSGATGCSSNTAVNALNPTTGNAITVEYDGDDTFTTTLTLATWAGTYSGVTLQSDSGQATLSGASNQPVNIDDDTTSATIQSFTMKDFNVDNQGSWGGANGTQIYIELGDTTTQTYDNVDGDNTSDGTATYGAHFARIIRPGANTGGGSVKVEIKNSTVVDVGPEPFGEHPDSTDAYAWEVDNKGQDEEVYVYFHDNVCTRIEADCLHFRSGGDVANDSLLYNNTSTDAGEETFDIKSSDYGKIYNNTMTLSGTYDFDSPDHIKIHSDSTDVDATDSHDWDVYENYFGANLEGGAIGLTDTADASYTTYNINVYDNYMVDVLQGVRLRYYSYNIDIYRNVMVFTAGVPTEALDLESTGTGNLFRSNSIYSDKNMNGINIVNVYGNADTIIEANAFYLSHVSAYAYYDNNATAKFDPTYNTWLTGGDELYINGGVQSSPFQNNSWEDPGFKNGASGDLSLTISSNARGNAGGSNESTNGLSDTSTWTPSFSIVTDTRDSSPDTGAYEFFGETIRGLIIQ
jgi:hypothetical protein